MSIANETQSSNTLINVLNLIQVRFVNQLPLIITIFGTIGFLGNMFTFLQPSLRRNSFCICILCGSIVDIINLFVNLFPNFIDINDRYLTTTIYIRWICKLKNFLLLFLPQLSMNFLITSLINRYACIQKLTSRIYILIQIKMVPYLILLTIIISCCQSLYALIMNDVVSNFGCISTSPIVNAILYIVLHGILTPLSMLILTFLTYRQFKRNRQRVGARISTNIQRFRNQFLAMIFAQIFITSFFVLQWIIMYCYIPASSHQTPTSEQFSIKMFVLSLSNNLYYMINVKSFYLATLTSRLFRKTFIGGIFKFLPGQYYQRWMIKNQRNLHLAE